MADPLNPAAWNRFNYVYGNPVNLVDPSGHIAIAPWDILDIVSFGASLNDFIQDPSLANAGWLALDTISLLPLVPAFGAIHHVGKLDDLGDTVARTAGLKGWLKQQLSIWDNLGTFGVPDEFVPPRGPGGNIFESPRVVLSGHGKYVIGSGWTIVPERTSVTVYSKLGARISDALGNAIELNDKTVLENGRVYSRVFRSGERIPNYTLISPMEKPFLTIKGNPITVTQDTLLRDLLRPGMGDVHWAACTSCKKAHWAPVLYTTQGPVIR